MALDEAIVTRLTTNLGAVSGIKRVYSEADLAPASADCPCIVIGLPEMELVGFEAQRSPRALAWSYHYKLLVLLSPSGQYVGNLTVTEKAFADAVVKKLYSETSLNGAAFDSQLDGNFSINNGNQVYTYGAQTYDGFELPWLVRASAGITATP